MESLGHTEIDLPSDFISFIESNYEKIFLISEKIKEFYEDSKPGKKYGEFRKVGSVYTDVDDEVVPIISAKIELKSELLKKLKKIEIEESHRSLDEKNRENLDNDRRKSEDISRKFPLLVLSPQPNQPQFLESISLFVEGVAIQLVDRSDHNRQHRQILDQGKRSLRKRMAYFRIRSSKQQRSFKKLKRKKKQVTQQRNESSYESFSQSGNTTMPTINEIAWDIYQKYESNKYTLHSFKQSIPPLHSSVLTLLGNRSSGNPSPRQGTVQIISPATKQKLRRHGRRRKSESTEKNGVDKVEDKDRIEGDDGSGSKGTIALENTDDTTTSEVGSNGRRDSQELTPQPSTQLYQILDKSLSRTRWYLSNDEIHTEIHLLEKVLGKSENKLRNNRKEDDLVSMSLIPNTQQQRSLKSS